MPASYSTLGYPPGQPDSTSLAIKLARVPLRADPSFQVTVVKSKYPCVQTSKGKPEESPSMDSTRCNHQGERKRNHPRGSHLRGYTESYRKWSRRNHPRSPRPNSYTKELSSGVRYEVSPSKPDSNSTESYH